MTSTQHKPNGTELVASTPWPDLFPFNGRLGQLLESLTQPIGRSSDVAPGGDLEEHEDAYDLELDLPGVAKDDIAIDVSGRRLSVTGSRTERERTGVLRHTTRTTGSFAYEITLPTAVDDNAVTAALADGVLKVHLPKAGGAKSTRIPIST